MKLDEAYMLAEEIGRLVYHNGYTFKVRSKEGKIPHIHFFEGSEKNPINEGCLALLYIGYANHGSYKGRLSRNDFNFICSWLSDDDNYKNVIAQWNEANVDNQVNIWNEDKTLIKNPYHR